MRDIHVARDGLDTNPGTRERPLATLHAARGIVRALKGSGNGPIRVLVHAGTHYLGSTLELGPEDSGTPDAPVTWLAAPESHVTLSGGTRFACRWRPYRGGIAVCEVPAGGPLDFGQLFVDGARAWETGRAERVPWLADGGAGLRLRRLGMKGQLRIDAALGLVDGNRAVSLGWQIP